MSVTEQILENPTLLIIAGAAFGLAWLSLAALLSWIITSPDPKQKNQLLISQKKSASQRGAPHVGEISWQPGRAAVRQPWAAQPDHPAAGLRDKWQYFHDILQQRMERLETALRAQNDGQLPGALADKMESLRRELENLRQAGGLTPAWEESYDSVLRHVDEFTEQVQRAAPSAELRGQPAPSRHSGFMSDGTAGRRPDYSSAASAVSSDVRREREQFLSRQADFEKDRQNFAAESQKNIDAAGVRAAQESARRAEAVRTQEYLAGERQRLQWRMEDMAAQRAAANKPYVEKLEQVKQSRDAVLRDWSLENEAARQESELWDKRLARRHARYEKWRAAWQSKISAAGRQLTDEQAAWDAKIRAAQEQLVHEKERADELTAHVEQERQRMIQETARFQEVVLAPREKQVQELEAQTKLLESEIESAQGNLQLLRLERVQQRARFDEAVRLTKAGVRDQQNRWKFEMEAAREETAKRLSQSEAEMRDLEAATQAEMQDLARKREIYLASLSAEKVALEAQKEVWQKTLDQEHRQKEDAIARARNLLAELRRGESDERSHLQNEIMSYQRRREELQGWARTRHESLNKLMAEIRDNSRERLMKLELEKNRLRNSITAGRQNLHQFFLETQTVWERQKEDLNRFQRAAELEHKQFMEGAGKEEEGLRKSIAQVEAQIDNLKKKLEHLNTKGEWRLNHEKERYERVILALKQKCEQAQATSEAGLATQKIQLDSLNRRMASRQARVERIKLKRQEQMTQLLSEAQQAVEAARRALWNESRQMVERLNQLREEKRVRDQNKEQLLKAPERLWQEVQQKSQDESIQYQDEKKRLEIEAETRLRDCQEKMAANEKALEESEALLKQMDGDLARQEALMQQFLTSVRHQVQQLASLRDELNNLAKPSSSKFSQPSVA